LDTTTNIAFVDKNAADREKRKVGPPLNTETDGCNQDSHIWLPQSLRRDLHAGTLTEDQQAARPDAFIAEFRSKMSKSFASERDA
jgi:hypothetical protein